MDLPLTGRYQRHRHMHGTTPRMPKSLAAALALPGGVVETMNVAPQYGGQLEPIMVAQTTRVALIVVLAPFLVISFAGSGAQSPLLAVPVVPWLPVLGLLAGAGMVATLLSRTR